ncbi:MAG: DUF1853 family protein [Flavobacteriaceae bacterium]|nr:DUF1853 family protein [Flavobacteriaceae bacterium]
MDFNSREIQLQYEGFLNTSFLWNDSFYGLSQLVLPNVPPTSFEGALSKNTRLGKRVESFVSHYLQQFEEIHIVKENAQIQNGNITVGEIDCLLLQKNVPTHLEIVYKFYLYDASVGTTEVEHWIGPNRNDSLYHKLDKLQHKQLPLLYKKECEPLLQKLDLDLDTIQQRVLFKAQLFVPYANENMVFNQLNSAAVSGFYINLRQLEQFKDCKFYIPTKLNWLLEPHKNVSWLIFADYKVKITEILSQKTSPLCWVKQPNGEISKFFITWWQQPKVV